MVGRYFLAMVGAAMLGGGLVWALGKDALATVMSAIGAALLTLALCVPVEQWKKLDRITLFGRKTSKTDGKE